MIEGTGSKKQILLVDDEADLAKMLCMLLETRGYNVQVAYTAEQALKRVNSDFDLILLDLVLPDSHGFDLCRKLKEHEQTRHIPIIMLSAHSLSENKVQGLYLGADDFLSKPCEHEELVARMEAVMRRRAIKELNKSIAREEQIINELRKILDESLIVPHYQPIYLLEPFELYGIEVLTRPSTESSLNNPEKFFKAALEYGLYIELEILAWTMALNRIAKLNRKEKIFFNCNPYFIGSSQLRKVKALFERNKIKPSDIIIEITERSAITDFKLFYKHLQEYRDYGFEFAVDDVGGGYASLESIVETHPTIIKIDPHIVQDLNLSKYKQSIVKFIVGFCQENGILSIAEGIETPEALEAVRALGVDAGQGYYFCKPTPDISLEEFRKVKF